MPELPDTLELIPTDEDTFSPDEELASVVDPDEDEAEPDVELPLGTTWLFDFDTRRLVMYGSTPVMVRDLDALRMWAMTALNTQRLRHPIFSEDFGRDDVVGPVGYVHDAERNSEYATDVRETLLVHDRISDVRDFTFRWDEDGILEMDATIVLDDDTTMTLEGVTIE